MGRHFETDITLILDRSGSMAGVVTETIRGFNQLIREHLTLPDPACLTLVHFDDSVEVMYTARDLVDVPLLDYENYQPSGATALLDAIGRGIRSASARLLALKPREQPRRVLFVIITDGLENASNQFDRRLIGDMIAHQQATNHWKFVFVGANQDVIASATALNIPSRHARSFEQSGKGTLGAFQVVSQDLRSFRSDQAAIPGEPEFHKSPSSVQGGER